MRAGFLAIVWLILVEVAPAAEAVTVDLQLKDRSWFTDRSAEAVAVFDEVVSEPEELPEGNATCHILGIEVSETPGSKVGKSVAVIRFLPKTTGLVTVPSLEFSAGETVFHTRPAQIVAGEPHRSGKMSISAVPGKTRVFVGEPLRVDLTWDCDLPAGSLRELRWFPNCFHDPDIEVVVPRNTGPEATQVGVPLGGRRVLATRTQRGALLGRIELPIYLRFTKPGKQAFGQMRLDCAVLSEGHDEFARYAAYFNNGLFEAVESGARYERDYSLSPAQEIEVLPLPEEGRLPDFSGLFDPVTAVVSVRPADVEVGQLIELEIKLSGEAPHGMLELPSLRRQPGLRGRFLVDDDYGRLWQENGTIFQTRLRALSTSVKALPSLRFQVFDPASGHYHFLTTAAVPLSVQPGAGGDFVPLNSYQGAVSKLTDLPDGIWHNRRSNFMNDLLNEVFLHVRRGFPIFLLAGPLLFLALLPWVRERRRRAIHPDYQARVVAFAGLKKLAPDSPGKWPAFLRFMAASFGADARAWTLENSREALRSIGATAEEIQHITILHEAADARDFSTVRPDAHFTDLDALARRVMRLLGNAALLCLAAWLCCGPQALADEWSEAEAAFQQATDAPAGSEAGQAAYQKAALKFLASAQAGSHPAEAWVNAGNSWFQAGAIGRSISAYLRARDYRPCDPKLEASLAAARALVANEVMAKPAVWKLVPLPWLMVALVAVNLVFWIVLLLTFRIRGRASTIAAVTCGVILLAVAGIYLANRFTALPTGVIIVEATDARKGPGFAYAKAFKESLRDGLEFAFIERRGDWDRIRLADGRECWVSRNQVEESSTGSDPR